MYASSHPFVMNSTPIPTSVGLLLCTTFVAALTHPACTRSRKHRPGGLDWCFHHLSNSRNVPATSVDSTFQVLLSLAHSGTFLVTAQKLELLTLPFRATVRVRR